MNEHVEMLQRYLAWHEDDQGAPLRDTGMSPGMLPVAVKGLIEYTGQLECAVEAMGAEIEAMAAVIQHYKGKVGTSASSVDSHPGDVVPHINWNHVDGPLLVCGDGCLHWLTPIEALMARIGLSSVERMERKYNDKARHACAGH